MPQKLVGKDLPPITINKELTMPKTTPEQNKAIVLEAIIFGVAA